MKNIIARFLTFLRNVIAKYFYFAVKWIVRILISFKAFSKYNPILVLTFGKSGSSSIFYTLKKNFKYRSIYHIHFLSPERIKWAEKIHLEAPRKSLPLHLIVSKELIKKIEKYNGIVDVITVLREPISRKVSSIFQNINLHFVIKNSKLLTKTSFIINELHRVLNDNESLYFEENWLDEEIRNHLGIDVYSKKFNFDRKYEIFENEKYRLLLLRMEDIDTVIYPALKEFFSFDKEFKLINKNIGDTKDYAKAYNEVKNKFSIDPSLLEKIFNSRYYKHFYSDYILNVKKKWCKK